MKLHESERNRSTLAMVATIQQRLLDWYADHRRDLPWRRQTDPYALLVSEVMLQQTGVERVSAMYSRFLERFPSFEALAAAPRVEVLQAWAGLGYNRRAINLHECARRVVDEHGGRLPDDPEQLRRLPGIGPYTVAALSSIAFHRDAAALDTNVRRVVGRLVFGYPAPDAAIARAAAELLPPGRSADWNQALMDFGSLQCTSARPACQICPLADVCAAAPVSDKRSVDRRVAESPEPYLGSRRFYRGRVVAVLRDLKSDETIPLAGLLALLKDEPAADDEAWLRGLVANLARDGLARIIDDAGSVRVGPPQ